MNYYELFDCLRGELSVDEYLTILSPLGGAYFISHHRVELSKKLTHEWPQLIEIENNLNRAITEHFEEIEKLEPVLANTLTLLWSSVKISDTTLKKLMLNINNSVKKETIGFWMKGLIEETIQFIGARSGFITTVSSISQLIGGLLTKRETLYDGTCGCGNLLVECAGGKVNKTKIYGQEINEPTAAIAKLNVYVNGIEDFDIKCANTLSTPQHKEGIKLMQFDNVVMNIPFALKGWNDGIGDEDLYNRFQYGMPGKNNGDYAFILHALASLNNRGKAYIIVPMGVLFREATEGKIRKELIKQDLVEGVIALPNNLLINTAIPVSILILNRNKEQGNNGKITFINAQHMGTKQRRQMALSDKEISTIITAYNGQEEIDSFMRIVDTKHLDGNNLNVNRYFIKNEIRVEGQMYELNIDAFERKGYHVTFCDVAEFYRGINPPNLCEVDATHQLVLLSDVQQSRIVKDDLTPVQLLSEHKALGYTINNGDVIISARGSNVKIVLAAEEDEGLILSNHFIGIRPKNGMTGECIKTYLESPLGQFYLQQRMQGSAIAVLKEKDLYNMPFPLVEKAQAKNISNAVNGAEEQLQNTLHEAYRQYNLQLQNVYDVMRIKEIIQ